jgi:hypothetical protein
MSFLNEELRKQRTDNLERESEMKDERISYLERENQRLLQFERANTALEEMSTILEEKYTASEKKNPALKEKNSVLEESIRELQEHSQMHDPLALVGFRIRWRFLEKACRRASSWEHYEHDYDDRYVYYGNEAARRPDFEADLALAKLQSGNSRIQKMVRAVYGSESIPSNDVPVLFDSKTRHWWHTLTARPRTVATCAELNSPEDKFGVREYLDELNSLQKEFLDLLNVQTSGSQDYTNPRAAWLKADGAEHAEEVRRIMSELTTEIEALVDRRPGT